MGEDEPEDAYQTAAFDAAKAEGMTDLRGWFRSIYEVVFGSSEGPRMGPFVRLYGAADTAALIRGALERDA